MLDAPAAADDVEILLLNDQNTPFDFVVDLLRSVFGRDDVEARLLAATAHHYGEVSCGAWPPSVAAALLEVANSRVEAVQHSLSFARRSAAGRNVVGQAQCGFCGLPEAQVATLYGTKAARICDRCVLQASAHLSGSIKSAKFRHSKEILDWHFAGTQIEELVTSTRVYPERSRADLQRALDEIMPANTVRLVGVKGSFRYEALTFADLLQVQRDAKPLTPVQYADVDVGSVDWLERFLSRVKSPQPQPTAYDSRRFGIVMQPVSHTRGGV
ncbi:ATP-dependent Clp protease adaptor ClpS [Pelagibius marinus]|uniref:ATP-dependent Clp protease adaptor ClpS n=1 Tax=Pelagibius marinus TaxID=2762760 RepID=UPI0018733378|nr:ATP-dependent Clp protease adaptor ClpS [Pelagibius marinus]